MNPRNLPRKFFRAAEARQSAAELLLRAGYNCDALYLAEIAAECAIKALILTYVPVNQRLKFDETNFRGTRAHRFDFLRDIMQRLGCPFPIILQPHWRRLTTWSIELRYDSTHVPTRDATRFLESSAAAINVAKERI